MRSTRELIIIGASTPTIIRVVDDINRSGNDAFHIVGFLDNRYKEIGEKFFNFPVLGGFELINEFNKEDVVLINTIAGDMITRQMTTDYFLIRNYTFTNIVHPSVNLGNVIIGQGNLIYENATVHPFVSIGNHNIISSNCGIAHETELGDYVFVGPAAYVCGKCSIGRGAYIGVGARILPRLRIGCDSVIGAGAVVTKNVPDSAKYIGIPARKV